MEPKEQAAKMKAENRKRLMEGTPVYLPHEVLMAALALLQSPACPMMLIPAKGTALTGQTVMMQVVDLEAVAQCAEALAERLEITIEERGNA